MQARQGQIDADLARLRDQHELRTRKPGAHVACAHIGWRIQPETQHAPVLRALDEGQCERVVGIDHGNTIHRQGLIDRALGLGHTLQAAHAFQMSGGDVVDQGHRRRRDRGEISNVAGLACTHLVDRVVRIVRCRKHRQRQTDFIVAVAGIRVGGTQLTQNRMQQGFDRRLAIAAGHCQHAGRALALHRSGKFAQGALGVFDHHLRDRGIDLARHQRGHAATGGGSGHMRMPVEGFALERDEERRPALRQSARVGCHCINRTIHTDQATVGRLRNPREQARRHACLRRQSRATSASSNGCLTPFTS